MLHLNLFNTTTQEKARKMNEIKFPLNATTKPFVIGMAVLLVMSACYCFLNTSGELIGNASGVLLFGVTVGNINRNWDPFVLGAFTGLVTHLWGKVPVYRYGNTGVKFSEDNRIIASFLIGFALLTFFPRKIFTFYPAGFSHGFLTALLVIVFTPFGMKGAIFLTCLCGVGLYMIKGSVPAVLLVSSVYIGKWLIWWAVNIIRHGFTETRKVLRTITSPPAEL